MIYYLLNFIKKFLFGYFQGYSRTRFGHNYKLTWILISGDKGINFKEALALIDRHDRDLHASWMELHQLLRGEYKASVPEAVVAAFVVFLLTNGDFKNGIVYSGNFGRDSDTIGAVAGALAGAMCGLSGIPEDWTARTRNPSGTCLQFTDQLDIVDVAHKLTELR